MTLRPNLELGAVATLFSDETMTKVVDYFLRNYMFAKSVPGSLADEYYRRASKPGEYSLNPLLSLVPGADAAPRPKLTVGQLNRTSNTELLKRRTKGQKPRYTAAFAAALPGFWNALKTTTVAPNGGLTFGPAALGLSLKDSMPRRGKTQSKMNSFFMAVEFGTGVFAAAKFRGINANSPAKVGNRGIWAYSNAAEKETSPLFLGQRPFHLFYDKSGNPRRIYAQFIKKHLPTVFKKVFKEVRRQLRNGP